MMYILNYIFVKCKNIVFKTRVFARRRAIYSVTICDSPGAAQSARRLFRAACDCRLFLCNRLSSGVGLWGVFSEYSGVGERDSGALERDFRSGRLRALREAPASPLMTRNYIF